MRAFWLLVRVGIFAVALDLCMASSHLASIRANCQTFAPVHLPTGDGPRIANLDLRACASGGLEIRPARRLKSWPLPAAARLCLVQAVPRRYGRTHGLRYWRNTNLPAQFAQVFGQRVFLLPEFGNGFVGGVQSFFEFGNGHGVGRMMACERRVNYHQIPSFREIDAIALNAPCRAFLCARFLPLNGLL